MKWFRLFTAVVAILGTSAVAQAGILDLLSGQCGAEKSCGCASSCQPECCKPTITRPCDTSVHTYQRKCSTIKPPCCSSCCGKAPSCCAPAKPKCCAPAANACGKGPNCAKPAANACGKAPTCCKPAANACGKAPSCCKPSANACGKAPTCCKPSANACGKAPSCCKPAAKCCDAKAGCCDNGGCGDCCDRCCDADPCEIAELIYESQTACYAKHRKRAIDKLGDRFDCVCNPEIMVAFVYALNDADEDVRAEAADEIGDQIRKSDGCCCSPEVVAALTCALGDCDRHVRNESEEALELCGYEVVDGCCDSCCDSGCTSGCDACGGGAAPAAKPAPAKGAAPAPAPPEEPKAYFPSRLNQKQTLRPIQKRSKLADLFGLLD